MSSDSTEEKETKSFQTCKSDTSLLIYARSKCSWKGFTCSRWEERKGREKEEKRGWERVMTRSFL